MKFPKFKLIYILGGGHSGSTLLDMLIGSSKEVFSVGELFFFDQYKEYQVPSYKLSFGRVCSCGQSIDNCSFWTRVNLDSKENIVKVESFAPSLKIFINILNPFENKISFKNKIGKNKIVLGKIFRAAISEKEKLKYILESSKDPRRLYELIKDKNISNDDIFVVHLVRDGRGYINSYKSKKRAELGLKVRSSIYYLLEWILINFSSERIINKYGLKSFHVSYDLFANDPTKYIKRINKLLHINIDAENYLDNLNNTKYHNIHGNIMRFKSIDKIKYDKNWEKSFSQTKRAVFSILLYPFNRRWVYCEKNEV